MGMRWQHAGTFARFLGKVLVPKLRWKLKCLVLVLMGIIGVVLWDKFWLQSEDFDALLRVDPLPHTQELVAQTRYAEAHEYLSFFMDYDYVQSNPEAVALYEEISAKRESYLYQLQKVAEGVVWGQSDELEGQIAAVATDFLVIGDVRDLTLEGMKWAKGEEVDSLTAALSTIGVVATAGTLVTAGTSATAKPALSFLKLANKTDKMPKWLRSYLIKQAKLIKKTRRLDSVDDLFDAIYRLFRAGGVRNTLVLLDKADDVPSLKKLTAFGTTFGKKSSTLLEISGDSGIRVFQQMDKVPKGVFLEAATYGENGVKTLEKVGISRFQRFLRRTKISARTVKVSYKHREFLTEAAVDILRNSVGLLPTWILWSLLGYGGALVLRRGAS